MLQKIVDLIRRPKPSAVELQAALAEIDPKIAEAAVDQLESERQKLLLQPNSDAELEAIEARIRAGHREVERQFAAKRELEKLLTEATARDALAAVEQTAAEARAARERLVGHYAEIDRLASAMADRLAAIVADHATIRQTNQVTLDADRRDLKVSDPLAELALLVGVANTDGLPNPSAWRLGAYWPLVDSAGNPVGNKRPLARITELRAPEAKRRAA